MADIWEQYRGGETKPVGVRMHVTINKRSVITLNRKVFEMLGEPRAALLFFNKHRSGIAISKIHETHEDKFRVAERAGYWVINAAPFCRHHGIRLDRTEKFTNIDQAPDGTLRLDLKDTVTVSIAKKKKRIT